MGLFGKAIAAVVERQDRKAEGELEARRAPTMRCDDRCDDRPGKACKQASERRGKTR